MAVTTVVTDGDGVVVDRMLVFPQKLVASAVAAAVSSSATTRACGGGDNNS